MPPIATGYASVRPPTKGLFNLFKGLQSSVKDLEVSPEKYSSPGTQNADPLLLCHSCLH